MVAGDILTYTKYYAQSETVIDGVELIKEEDVGQIWWYDKYSPGSDLILTFTL